MSNGWKWPLLAACALALGCRNAPSTSTATVAATSVVPSAPPVQAIPYVLPAWQYVTLEKRSICWGADAGANDTKLWWAMETCSMLDALDPRLPQSCSGSCHLYGYVDFGLNGCNTASGPLFRFNNTQNEAGLLHKAPNPIAQQYRLSIVRKGKCSLYGSKENLEYYQNLGNAALQSYLYANVWNNRDVRNGGLQNGFGVMNDDIFTAYAPIIYNSTEYGGAYLWQRPSGRYAAEQTWYSALAAFFNSMCPTGGRCVHTSFNGFTGGAKTCESVIGGSCYGSTKYSQGYLNNTVNAAQLCNALTQGNVDGAVSERRLYGHGNLDGKWSSTGLIAASVNTTIAMALGMCSGLKYIDLEQPAGSPTIRFYMTGLQWLVPDQRTGIPDKVVQWRYATGPPNSQIASFWPEYTVVPQGPEQTLTEYHYSGTAPHEALGCPTSNGDFGGVVALVVSCSGSSPVWAMQYRHCFINRADVGKCATLINTAPNSVNVTASMFKHDPIATYRWQFVFSGLQMANVQMGDQSISTGCAVPEYCDGKVIVNGLAFKGDGTDSIPARSAIFIHQ